MRHKKKGRKFKKSKDQQRALLRSLTSCLVIKEKIITTEARSKELRSFVEKSITRAKKDSLANQRLLLKDFSKKVVKKLIKDLGTRYKNRSGGYTKITKISPRKSDGAKMAVIELVK